MQVSVAHVLRKYDPAEWGGTETHVAAVTRELENEGVHSVVHAPRGPAGVDFALDDRVPLRRYTYLLPYTGPAAERRALIKNAGNILPIGLLPELLASRPTLAHLHTQGRVGATARTAMRFLGRPYVVSVHGPLFTGSELLKRDLAERAGHTRDWGSAFGLFLGARRVLADAARVISFNDAEHAELQARIGERAVRMDHGVDVTWLRSGEPQRGRQLFPALGDRPVIGVLGRLAEQKNQVLAVRAFAEGAPRDHLLALAGAETDAGYRARVEAEARALGVAERVVFLGNLSPTTEVPHFLARCRLLLVPSRHEAFGLAVLEAWAARRPVLFTDQNGLADIARVYARPGFALREERAWGPRLGALLADPGEMLSAAAAGQALVLQRYTWRAAAQRLAALYDEVVAERAGQARAARRAPVPAVARGGAS